MLEAHRSFLFARDYTALALLIAVVAIPLTLLFVRPTATQAVYIALLIGQFLVVRNAGARAGERFVGNVLALA